ncbi:hypothetical protein SDC9_210231 [bioreactor metagenome]|uniref:Uncharacterized protein n=1 Tax=bioreactor metagenome TaxID=1076179 RepID=A0A645JGY0_9ZZZZ
MLMYDLMKSGILGATALHGILNPVITTRMSCPIKTLTVTPLTGWGHIGIGLIFNMLFKAGSTEALMTALFLSVKMKARGNILGVLLPPASIRRLPTDPMQL